MLSKLTQLKCELKNVRSYIFKNNKEKQSLRDRKNNIQRRMLTFSSEIELRKICFELEVIERSQKKLNEREKYLESEIKKCSMGCRETSRLF
jgi:predicted  nucleic acid-binding Zn-ribbon protein